MGVYERAKRIVDGLTDEEKVEVLNIINQQMRDMKSQREVDMYDSLRVGQRVRVVRKGTILWTGIVRKKMRKNVLVEREGTYTRYRVPPAMLEVIIDG